MISKILKTKTDDIAFIELKEGKTLEINGDIYKGPLTLPIKVSNVLNIVKKDIHDIPITMIVEGILYVFSLIPDYEHMEIYKKILNSFSKDYENYVLSEAIKFYNDENYEEAFIILEGLKNIGVENPKILFTLGNSMENLDISALSEEEKKKFAIEIMNLYESILNIDENFSLSHYKLGYIYKNFSQYKKSELSFKKFLNISDNDLLKQEVREVLDSMEADILFEEAMLKIDERNFEIALNLLLKIEPSYRNDLIYYNMSVCYMNLYDFEAAEDAINSAMEISDESLYHNQLAMIFEREGDFETAVNILKDAIDLFGKDYILNYNLATIEFNSGDFESATENFEIAYEIKPSTELKNLIEYVKGEKFKGELN